MKSLKDEIKSLKDSIAAIKITRQKFTVADIKDSDEKVPLHNKHNNTYTLDFSIKTLISTSMKMDTNL